jgi:hypothetical protein
MKIDFDSWRASICEQFGDIAWFGFRWVDGFDPKSVLLPTYFFRQHV